MANLNKFATLEDINEKLEATDIKTINGQSLIGSGDIEINGGGELNYVTPEMFGAVGDGVTDDTDAVQNAINTKNPVYCKNTYNVFNIHLNDNSYLYGGGTFKIPHLTQSKEPDGKDKGFKILNKTNIVLKDLTFIGSGEFLQGYNMISIRGCDGLIIEKCNFYSPESDAICLEGQNIEATTQEFESKNIVIKDCIFKGEGTGRNAISVILGENITIDGCSFDHFGRWNMPGCIDLEPNPYKYHFIKNTLIKNCVFKNGGGNGGDINIYIPENCDGVFNTRIENCNFYPPIIEPGTGTSHFRKNINLKNNTANFNDAIAYIENCYFDNKELKMTKDNRSHFVNYDVHLSNNYFNKAPGFVAYGRSRVWSNNDTAIVRGGYLSALVEEEEIKYGLTCCFDVRNCYFDAIDMKDDVSIFPIADEITGTIKIDGCTFGKNLNEPYKVYISQDNVKLIFSNNTVLGTSITNKAILSEISTEPYFFNSDEVNNIDVLNNKMYKARLHIDDISSIGFVYNFNRTAQLFISSQIMAVRFFWGKYFSEWHVLTKQSLPQNYDTAALGDATLSHLVLGKGNK